MSRAPVPIDIPLPMPAPEPVLVAVLVGFFLMHIAFVNFMVGGVMLTLWYEVRGLKEKRFDHLAHAIASTITANKSIAVVLGVGPLLAINTLYTVYFYTANALTGLAWISVIPLVAIAFLLTYAHKYLWVRLERYKELHITLIVIVLAIFLFIPLVFLTNINLMLQPSAWTGVKGFWSALILPNVLPRYVHFLLACPAMTGLFLVWLFRRQDQARIDETGFSRSELVRTGYRWAFWPTLAQFLVGPLALITLPPVSGSTDAVTVIFALSLVVAAALALFMLIEMRSEAPETGKGFGVVCALMLVTVLMMGAGRHLYREAAVEDHRDLVRAKTADFVKASAAARRNASGPNP